MNNVFHVCLFFCYAIFFNHRVGIGARYKVQFAATEVALPVGFQNTQKHLQFQFPTLEEWKKKTRTRKQKKRNENQKVKKQKVKDKRGLRIRIIFTGVTCVNEGPQNISAKLRSLWFSAVKEILR